MSVEYDERLLASAPAATRKEKQEGYNIDLLDQGRGGATSGSSTPPALAPNENYAENGLRSKEVAADFSNGPTYTASTTTPWYKTKKGLIILFIAAVVVIGAVVGGAVGGTVGRHKKNSTSAGSEVPAPVQGAAPPDTNPPAGSPPASSIDPNLSIPGLSNTRSPSPSPSPPPSGNPDTAADSGPVPVGGSNVPDSFQAVSGVSGLPP